MKRHFEGSTVGDDASAAGLAHMRLHTPAEPKDWGSDKVYGQRAGLVVPASAWWCRCCCFAVSGRLLVQSDCKAIVFTTSSERPHVEGDQIQVQVCMEFLPSTEEAGRVWEFRSETFRACRTTRSYDMELVD